MKHLFLSCLLASAMTVNAQSTFYVDQSHPSASDSNPGTADAPWASLNASKWTDGCTVILKGEYYMDATESNEITVNATLTGTDNAVIYGYETGEEMPADYLTFFTCADKSFTVKNLDIANFHNTTNDNWGGIFEFGSESELILENVNISNVFLGGQDRRGGAISTSGKLTATNVNFENCAACRGGAVSIVGSNPAKFTSCSFIGNSNNIGEECWPRGGALTIAGDENGSDLTVDKCYFEKNISDYDAESRKNAAGGAIAVFGASPKLHVSNSTFYANVAGWAGGAIYFDKDVSAANAIDFRFINNTFLDNTIVLQSTNHGVIIYFNGGSSELLTGTFAMINNTSFNNNTPNPNSVVFMNSCPLDIVLANNLSLDKAIVEIDGAPVERGWGYTFQENAEALFHSVEIRNNIIEAGIGGGHISFADDDLKADDLYNIFSSTELRPMIELASDLSMQDGLGYLAIGENSLAIDGGTNSLMFAGANIVPDTDMLGKPIVNGKRDIGAWEFGNSAGIESVETSAPQILYDGQCQLVKLSETARMINIYDLTGKLMAHANDTDHISVARLPKGMFMVVAIVDNAPVTTKILR